jgi:hypothetical protein
MRKGIGVRAAAAIGAPWCCVLVATLFVALSGGTFTPSASAAPQKPECADRIDNDGDGLVDFARSEGDPGCASRQDASERGTLVCDNGADDDADTRTDYPGDPGCSSATDDSELGTTACDNGFDDDLDTYHDMRDVGCDDPADASEKGASVCDDGNDDDGDGSSDYPLDHGCTGPWDDSELGSTACDDGIDNDGDGLQDFSYVANAFPVYPLRRDPGCGSPVDDDERGSDACDDGVDNDQDGFVDYLRFGGGDPECDGPWEQSETAACNDGVDNDQDGFIDYVAVGEVERDPQCLSPDDDSESTA